MIIRSRPPEYFLQAGYSERLQRLPYGQADNWAAEAIERWKGPERKGFQNWTDAFHNARNGELAARED